MQTPELKTQTSEPETPETPLTPGAELTRPLKLDPLTGDPLIYPGLSAAIEARLVPMMRKHRIGQPGTLDLLLTVFDEDGFTPRNRVRTLLLMAAGMLARRHKIITEADWAEILSTPGGEPCTPAGWKVERRKRLLARILIDGVIGRGEVRRATV